MRQYQPRSDAARSVQATLTVTLITIALIITSGGLVFGEPYPFTMVPAYDSGWTEFPVGPSLYTHDLGGNPDDYLVDLQFRRPDTGWATHVVGFGCDYRSNPDGQLTSSLGAALVAFDETSYTLFRLPTDTYAPQFRVRIWFCVVADFDSGWRSIAPGAVDVVQHNLGGDAERYGVRLVFRDGDGNRHLYGYGGDRFLDMGEEKESGAWWQELTSSQVTVRRGMTDSQVHEYQLRIWARPRPHIDSGWIPLAASAITTFDHALGGPWNDLAVDVLFRDGSGALGIHHRGFGDDGYRDPALTAYEAGGDWWALTGSRVNGYRGQTDDSITEMRIRVWERPQPDYDSGWALVAPGPPEVFDHGLTGDPDSYVVDLQFHQGNPDGKMSSGLNLESYGGDTAYDPDAEQFVRRGAAWFDLTATTISVTRASHDTVAEYVHLRIWRAPEADFDSGWFPLEQGTSLDLEHNLGGSPDDFVVDMQMKGSSTYGINQRAYGLDTYPATAAKMTLFRGTTWSGLTATSITVIRADDDSFGGEARVRIWKNTQAAWTLPLTEILGYTSFEHKLGIDASDLIIDLQHECTEPTLGRNHMYYGGDRVLDDGSVDSGVHWRRLTEHRIDVSRNRDDSVANNGVRIRIWADVAWKTIFRDGFETGSTYYWGTGP
ncbi:MAG: hypothetical protein K8R59_06545 [Thermoanaerobaculales bacterium]|nr:hypothetical protein [Thermoanaerobaculales bacterium]